MFVRSFTYLYLFSKQFCVLVLYKFDIVFYIHFSALLNAVLDLLGVDETETPAEVGDFYGAVSVGGESG